MTYIAYQTRLFKNSLMFDAKIVPIYRVLERAIFLTIEYHFNATSMTFDDPNFYGSYAAMVVIQKILFISCEPLPPKFIKISFDENVRDATDDVGYIIRDLDNKLLVTRTLGFSSFLSWRLNLELLGQVLATLDMSFMRT